MRGINATAIVAVLVLSSMVPVGALRGDDPPRAPGPVDRSLPWVTGDAGVEGVVHRTFESTAAAGPVSYHVYVPPEHDQPDARLPVLYWLHGTLGGIEGIRPLTAHFAAQMRSRRMPPMLVVFVNGLPRRLWADSKGGSAPVETVFVTELIPQVDRSFRTLAAREGRVLEGFSMGGYGAARLGFAHPDLFAGISILAGGPLDLELDGPRARRNPRLRDFILREVCGGEIDYFREISPVSLAGTAAKALGERGTVIRQAVGTRDDTRDLNHAFHERLAEVGIAHVYHEIPEVGHDARGVLAALAAADGDFYRRALGSPAAGARGGPTADGTGDP
ncbi:MAG: alpha/beta hydrolase [Planctomycetaceae bacterium]